jgi:hypothetical protein
MQKLFPPLFLFLALAGLIGGFTLVIVPAPEPGMNLHRARVRGDDQLVGALENELERRRRLRTGAIVILFAASGLCVVAAFASMPTTR